MTPGAEWIHYPTFLASSYSTCRKTRLDHLLRRHLDPQGLESPLSASSDASGGHTARQSSAWCHLKEVHHMLTHTSNLFIVSSKFPSLHEMSTISSHFRHSHYANHEPVLLWLWFQQKQPLNSSQWLTTWLNIRSKLSTVAHLLEAQLVVSCKDQSFWLSYMHDKQLWEICHQLDSTEIVVLPRKTLSIHWNIAQVFRGDDTETVNKNTSHL